MGLTAENVQVRTAQAFSGAAQRRVAEAARDFVLRAGFEETGNESEADRTLVIGPQRDGWVSVYDTEIGVAEKLAQAVSKATKAAAVGLMVYDSDDVFIWLIDNGKTKDRFERSEGRRKRKGDPAKWNGLANVAELEAAFGAEPLFAEDQIEKLATALAIPPDACLTNFEEVDSDDALRIFFKAKGTDAPKTSVGLPSLKSPGHGYEPFRFGLGETLPAALTMYVHNYGGPMNGIAIQLGGSAIQEGIVEITNAEMFAVNTDQRQSFTLEPGQRSLFWPDLQLSAGVPEPTNVLALVRHLKKQRTAANTVTLALRGVARNVGAGDVKVKFVPLQNPDQGWTTETRQVIVRPSPRRPLKADPAASGRFEMYQRLATPRTLVAVAALDGDWTPRAQDAILKWTDFIGQCRPDSWYLLHTRDMMGLPKDHRSKNNDLSSDKKFKQWIKEIGSDVALSGFSGDERTEGRERFEGSAGFGLEAKSPYGMVTMSPNAPQLGFWLDTKIFPDDEVAEAEQLLVDLLDELAGAGCLLQGFIARWAVGSMAGLGGTLYETASGVMMQCTTLRGWCTRYLRGAGDWIWLGPEIATRISTDGVPTAGEITPVGESIRIRRVAYLDDLEKALEPILPGEEEWKLGMAVLYRGASW